MVQYVFYKKPPVKQWIMNKMLAGYSFLPLNQMDEIDRMPLSLYQTYGVNINGTTIYSILCIKSERQIKETEADAILADFWLAPDKKRLMNLVSATQKPIFISLKKGVSKTEKIIYKAKMYEEAGVSAIFTSNLITPSVIEKIRSSIEIPIISKSDPNPESIIAKHRAGADIICIMGMEISRDLLETVKQTFPFLSFLSFSGNSEEIIVNSLASGADAIIYNPWSTVDYF
jgi:hypothetical protein